MSSEYKIISEDVADITPEYEARLEYSLGDSPFGTQTGEDTSDASLFSPLSSNLDIFENLREDQFSAMPRVSRFLKELRTSITENAESLKDVHYNRLSIEESSHPGELMIDWIYNYFRAFFSFDDKEGDMYGLIVNNTETKQFVSEFQPLMESDYYAVAARSVGFITENLRR